MQRTSVTKLSSLAHETSSTNALCYKYGAAAHNDSLSPPTELTTIAAKQMAGVVLETTI